MFFLGFFGILGGVGTLVLNLQIADSADIHNLRVEVMGVRRTSSWMVIERSLSALEYFFNAGKVTFNAATEN